MLIAHSRGKLESYSPAQDCSIWMFEADSQEKRTSVAHYLTLADANTLYASLGRAIKAATAYEEEKAEADRLAAEFAAFKASKLIAAE